MPDPAIKERPILFNAPMVRALLDGRKVQTRRVVTPQPGSVVFAGAPGVIPMERDTTAVVSLCDLRCPYGVPGDRLWVREAFNASPSNPVRFRADYPPDSLFKWRPSIHMPRGASRLLLEVTDVRVQRVQEISEADAIAEGVERNYYPQDNPSWSLEEHGYYPYCHHYPDGCECEPALTAVDSFHGLWDSINAARGYAWSLNPWVWAVSFKVLEGGAADA